MRTHIYVSAYVMHVRMPDLNIGILVCAKLLLLRLYAHILCACMLFFVPRACTYMHSAPHECVVTCLRLPYTCTCTRLHTHEDAYIHACPHAMYACINTYIGMYAFIHTCMHEYTHTCIHTCLHSHMPLFARWPLNRDNRESETGITGTLKSGRTGTLNIHVYIHMHERPCVCMYVCIYVYKSC